MKRRPKAEAGARDDWETFVIAYGWRSPAHELAAVLDCSVQDVLRVRSTGACARRTVPLRFAELFSLRHGRPPTDADWPAPRKGHSGSYEWQPSEDAVLAGLVGQLGVREIAQMLNARLQVVTGDALAARARQSVQLRINRLGLQSSDVLGGITVATAAREIGSRPIVQQSIRDGLIRTRKVGRLLVIPHDQWSAWKARRNPAPQDKVRLSSIREALGIRSDAKLPEFAKLGYIPTAELHAADREVQRGEWYIAEDVARTLVEDRRAGRPMPWHGKPLEINLKGTYRLWRERQHPVECATCQQIWGDDGPPATFADYSNRYPPLAHGAKRHLTRVWTPGLTLEQVAEQAQCQLELVTRAVDNGVLCAELVGGLRRVTQTAATRWIARRCPNGDSHKSWLSVETAMRLYYFTLEDVQGFIDSGRLRHKVGSDGAMRGVNYVLKQQCAELRASIGFTHAEGSRRAGVTPERFSELLKGVHWRQSGLVPLPTLQAVIKRLKSAEGYTAEDCAIRFGMPAAWVHARIADGTIRVRCNKWNPERIYISEPMFKRLQAAVGEQPRAQCLGPQWLLLSDAARLAGVTAGTLLKWFETGDLVRQRTAKGWRYREQEVKARARQYWPTVRFHRAVPPAWLQDELAAAAAGIKDHRPSRTGKIGALTNLPAIRGEESSKP